MGDTPDLTLNDGIAMPQLGLGVWQTPAEDAARIVATALDAGYQAVDTAAIYGNEEGVGQATEGRDVFVTTKLWNSDQGFDSALRAFEKSAKKLRRDVVDLYLIHWPAPRQDRFVESWKAMIRLKEEGRIRLIGVSNFNVEHLQRIIDETGVAPSINQVELHPDFQQKTLRAFHSEYDIATESWSPLGQGRLLENPVLGEVAAKHGVTPAQAIIRWHLDNGLVVIPKSVKAERIAENIDVFGFRLDEEDLARIGRLDSEGARIGPNPASANF